MNIGISKEQLYITPPFTEIFSCFQAKLGEAGIIIIAGYSFRDPAVNRMLLESLKHKRVPVVAVNPQIEALMERHPVVQALREYGVLIACSKSMRQISQDDVDQWFEATLKPAPEGVTFPPGKGQPGFYDRDRAVADRVHHLVVELSLVEHYLCLVLGEIDAGRPVVYGLLDCLVKSLERCRETYYQALIVTGVTIQSEPVWHGVRSPEPVNLIACRKALTDALVSLKNILSRLESSQPPFQIIPSNIQELCKDGTLQGRLEYILLSFA